MELGESIWSAAVAALVAWRLARSIGFDRLLALRLPIRVHGAFSHILRWETVHLSGLLGRLLDAIACISIWVLPQVSVYVLTGSAGAILIGLFAAATRRMHGRLTMKPAARGYAGSRPGKTQWTPSCDGNRGEGL